MADGEGAPAVDNGAPQGEGAPDPGQNGGGAPQDLYAKWVQQAPPELHDTLTQALHGYNREAVEPKLREHAEYRQRWEPFEQAGLDQADPQDLSEAYTLLQIFANPDLASEAVGDSEDFEAAWAAVGEKLGYFDDQEGAQADGEEPDPQYQALQSQLEQLQQTVQGFMGHQEQTERQQQVQAQIDAELGELQEQHNQGNKFDKRFEDMLYRLALSYDDKVEKPLHQAFEELQHLSGQAQTELVQSKLDQPAPANGNGTPATSPESFNGIGDERLRTAALARLKATA